MTSSLQDTHDVASGLVDRIQASPHLETTWRVNSVAIIGGQSLGLKAPFTHAVQLTVDQPTHLVHLI